MGAVPCRATNATPSQSPPRQEVPLNLSVPILPCRGGGTAAHPLATVMEGISGVPSAGNGEGGWEGGRG